jgi:phosphotriesterase-related protein
MASHKKVNTVTGEIFVDKLGKTLMHEHFVFGYPGYIGDSVYSDQHDEALEKSIDVAKKILASGISTVVDATPNDCGRDPLLLKKVSEETGLNIIASSGYYYQGEGAAAYFMIRNALGGNRDEDIYEIFKTEFTKGIGKTGIRPGVIKLATSKNIMTEYEESFFRAAARISIEENVSIITHTQEGTHGLAQADFLLSLGVDPTRIMIGHSCCNTDVDYLMSIAEKGVFIGLDRWGLQGGWGAPLNNRRIAILLGLIGAGYADSIMISQDTIGFWWGRPVELGAITDTWHPTHFVDDIIPILKKAGVSDSVLNTILIDNPTRFFSGSR